MFFAAAFSNIVFAGFYAPVIYGDLKANSSLTFSVSNLSLQTQSIVFYRALGSEEWNSCSLSESSPTIMNCTVSSQTVASQAVYEYYFNSSESRFPQGNATFRLPLSERMSAQKEYGDLFALNSSESPSLCDPWAGNYSCGYETQQAAMIEAYWTAARATDNSTYEDVAYQFALVDYEPISFISTCDHARGDFDCENANPGDYNIGPNASVIPRGVMRQSSLINSLWTAVQYGANSTVRELALNYTNGRAEGCNVWNSTFNCTFADDQGMMISAYWKAYEMTGNDTMRGIAENLTQFGLAMAENSSLLVSGLWKAYELTGNETYRDAAENRTKETELDKCTENSCSAGELYANVRALLEAYRVSAGYGYYNYARMKLTENSTGCNALESDYVCTDPREQGDAIIQH